MLRNDEHIREGDVVVFKKVEGSFAAGSYRYGMVDTVHRSADGQIRTVTVRCRNLSETIDRTTVRAVRGLIIIHRIDELNIAEELGKAMLVPSVDTNE